MNMLVAWMTEGPDSHSFKRHLERNLDFLWMANDGMRMNGTNGSQLWDTAFVCQAMVESGLAQEPEFHESMKQAHSFIDSMQV
jgi:lanosterol synthase